MTAAAPYSWQTELWTRFNALIAENCFPHAVLLHGPAGIGKEALARLLAQQLVCRAQTTLPCGECQDCLWWQAGHHPDSYHLAPIPPSRVIKVDQVREVLAPLHQTPTQRGSQVLLIHPAETLNHAAANAILKSLEEPPGRVVFISVTDQPSALPATFRSRCHLFPVPQPSQAQALSWLQAALPEASDLPRYLALAEGAPLAAKQLAESKSLDVYTTLIEHLFAKPFRLIETAEYCLKGDKKNKKTKQDLDQVLKQLLILAQDLVKVKLQAPDSTLVHGALLSTLQRFVAKPTVQQLIDWQAQLLQSRQQLRHHAGMNAQLTLEDILVNWYALS